MKVLRVNFLSPQILYNKCVPWNVLQGHLENSWTNIKSSVHSFQTIPKYSLLKTLFWYLQFLNSFSLFLIITFVSYVQLMNPDPNWNRNQTLMCVILLLLSMINLVNFVLYEYHFDECISTIGNVICFYTRIESELKSTKKD